MSINSVGIDLDFVSGCRRHVVAGVIIVQLGDSTAAFSLLHETQPFLQSRMLLMANTWLGLATGQLVEHAQQLRHEVRCCAWKINFLKIY